MLETLTPAERLAFVLHDMFAVPFDEIAPIVGRTPAAARQLASRARRRVQGAGAVPDADLAPAARGRRRLPRRRRAAATSTRCSPCSIPTSCSRADRTAVEFGADEEVIGAAAVAETFAGRARRRAARRSIDGDVGSCGCREEHRVSSSTSRSPTGRIVEIELLADAARLAALDLVILTD